MRRAVGKQGRKEINCRQSTGHNENTVLEKTSEAGRGFEGESRCRSEISGMWESIHLQIRSTRGSD